MAKTGIEWTDEVWNPIRGCSRVSPGCENCYAERFAARFSKRGLPWEGLVKWGKSGPLWTGEVNLIYDKLQEPMHWSKPRRVFVNSMSDLFHDGVPDNFIRDVFGVMAMAKRHTFQILTKRSIRMEQWFGSLAAHEAAEFAGEAGVSWPLPNVWLGVSVESQDWASERLPGLINSPAEVRFVSAEPLLDELDLTGVEDPFEGGYSNALQQGVDWVIVGCETGPRSQTRDMQECWVRDLRLQCRSNNTAFFYKQAKDENGRLISLPLLDGKSWSEYPI
jgi:protein gp37